MKTTPIILTLLLCLPVFTSNSHAKEVVQVGVATPQSQAEQGNIEILRNRAIRNATEIAVTQVAGALISGHGEDTANFIEVIKQKNDEVNVETRQNSRFRKSGATQSTGYVRLIEIIKEWQTGNQYWVKVKVAVGDQDTATEKINAGFYWKRVGKPEIALSFVEKANGGTVSDDQNYTLRYLRDNLVENGITVSDKNRSTIRYLVKNYPIPANTQHRRIRHFCHPLPADISNCYA